MPNTGALTTNLATPYPTGAYPTAIIAVPTATMPPSPSLPKNEKSEEVKE